MNRFWFRPKTYGYGATPVTWEGWALAAGYLIFVLVISLGLLGREPSARDVILWAAVLVTGTIGMTWLSWLKTEGEWRWRWGRTNTGKMF